MSINNSTFICSSDALQNPKVKQESGFESAWENAGAFLEKEVSANESRVLQVLQGVIWEARARVMSARTKRNFIFERSLVNFDWFGSSYSKVTWTFLGKFFIDWLIRDN